MENNNSRIPKLRFPGFTGEWEEKSLGDVGTFVRGLSYNKSEVTEDTSSVLVVRSNNIIQDGVVDCKNGLQYVNKAPFAEQILQKGDVVICLANGSSNLVGKTASFDGNYKGVATIGAFCGIYRSMSPITKYLVQTSLYKEKISLIKQGGNGALANLYGKDILGLCFYFPPTLAEQQKIALCLSELDDLISAQDQKVVALKEKKKGLMQQLFPQPGETSPRLRFPGFSGDWEDLKISDVADVLQGYGFPDKYQGQKSGELPFCKVGDISAAVDKGERIITKAANYVDYSLLSTLHAKPIPVGSTIFAKIGEAIRSNKRIKTGVPCLIDNNAAAVKAKNEDMDDFMFYLMSQIKLGDYSGGIVPSVNKSTIESIPILVPPIPAEQQKIASCLSALDDNIANEAVKFEVLKNHKKGLMQQLFPQPTK